MSSGRELELKLAVLDEQAARTLAGGDQVAGLRAGPWRTVSVSDQYLDTPSGALARAGYGARLRHADGATTLTVKSTGTGRRRRGQAARRRGVHDRLELEGRASRRLDPHRWPLSDARAVVQAHVGDERLRTQFVLDQRREERDLERDGLVVATLSLDRVTVRRMRSEVGSFATLEIESALAQAKASRALLDELATSLADSPAVRPERRSKDQIARAMLDGAPAAPSGDVPPRTPRLRADDSLAEAGRKVLRMHFLRMLVAETAVRTGDDVAGVHKMRVATRRMRAAWRVFEGAYESRLQRRYVDRLRTVAATLGAVRDIDVQLERLDVYRRTLDAPSAAALAPLGDEWQRRRAEARAGLIELLDSTTYERFVDDYRDFVDTPGAGIAGPRRRVSDVAAGRAWLAFERLRRHADGLPWADVAALHELRIHGKRLRYTLEFAREMLPPPTDRLLAQITVLQDHLGELNDAFTTADLTRDWLQRADAGLTDEQRSAAHAYVDTNEAEVARRRRTLAPIWRRLTARTFRRRLASALADV